MEIAQVEPLYFVDYNLNSGCYIYPKLLADIAGIDMELDGWKDWSYNLEHIDGSAVIVHKNRPEKK